MATRCRAGETPEQARARHAARAKQWRERNRERYLEKRREWTARNRTRLTEAEKKRYARRCKEDPEYKTSSLKRINDWQQKMGKDYLNQQSRDRTRQLKLEVIAAYGGKCICCGNSNPEFMTIHHIAGDGAEHRRSLFGNARTGGHRFYRWLKSQGFPKDNFELNCWNCNAAKELYGYCPHQREAQP